MSAGTETLNHSFVGVLQREMISLHVGPSKLEAIIAPDRNRDNFVDELSA